MLIGVHYYNILKINFIRIYMADQLNIAYALKYL